MYGDEELADARVRIRDLCTLIGSPAVLVSRNVWNPAFLGTGLVVNRGGLSSENEV